MVDILVIYIPNEKLGICTSSRVTTKPSLTHNLDPKRGPQCFPSANCNEEHCQQSCSPIKGACVGTQCCRHF